MGIEVILDVVFNHTAEGPGLRVLFLQHSVPPCPSTSIAVDTIITTIIIVITINIIIITIIICTIIVMFHLRMISWMVCCCIQCYSTRPSRIMLCMQSNPEDVGV